MTQHPSQLQLATLVASLNLASLEQAIRDAQPGQPGGTSYDPRTTSGQGPGDPTASAAQVDGYGWTGNKPGEGELTHAGANRAAEHLALFIKKRAQAYACLLELAWLQNIYDPGHARPRTQAKAETKGCDLHLRAGIEAHRKGRFSTDFADVTDSPLKAPVFVCRWCYDFPRRIHPDGDPVGRIPTPEEIRTYEQHGRVRLKARPKKRKAA